jgi:hypothetical protein
VQKRSLKQGPMAIDVDFADNKASSKVSISGFLEIMIAVAQGARCNNELSKELRKCLSRS